MAKYITCMGRSAFSQEGNSWTFTTEFKGVMKNILTANNNRHILFTRFHIFVEWNFFNGNFTICLFLAAV